MDFFSILTPELNTLSGEIVKIGTDSLLLGPDWNKNIELCDLINQQKQHGPEAIKAITHQLKSSEQKTVELSLIMLETCVKNCNSVHYLINKNVMDEIINIATGKRGHKNQDEALRLIQSWGKTFEKRRGELPIFYDTYIHLKTKGVQFPPLNPEDEIINTPSPSISSSSKTSSNSKSNRVNDSSIQSAISSQSNQSSKLQQDLKVVLEKVRLCREMLPESPGIYQDEILAEVIGFLEACQDRLSDLIEAGSTGVLNENDMELCLKVYESVMKTLEAEKNGTPIAVDDETTIILSETNQSKNNSSNSEKKSTMKASLLEEDEEDAFSNLTLKTPAASNTRSSIPILAPPPQSKGLVIPSNISNNNNNNTTASAAPAPAPIQSKNNDFPLLFPLSSSTPSQPIPNSLGSPGMSDAEFENFLNG